MLRAAHFAAQATQASAAPTYSVLQYKYVKDILEKRGPFRENHLAAARAKVGMPTAVGDLLHDSPLQPA